MKKEYEEELRKLACKVYDHPEPGFREYTASRVQTEFLRNQGFTVTENTADTVTGYTASWGNGHPVIAFLGEFDALYGLGQAADVSEYKPDGKEMGHGCGHHLLGTGCIGAGLLVRDYLKEKNCPGTVRVYGCPAEESGSGKAYMARDGVFDDVDIAFSWHPANYHQVCTGSSQSCIQAAFRFYGIPSHAAGAPEKGRSALDAVELMDVGVNYLREHMEDSDRVHYAITDPGGKSPNVVQARAEVKYLVRSTTNRKCQKLYDRVVNIARGAALMTETKLEVLFDEGLSNTIVNFTLEDVLADSFRKLGTPEYTKEDLEYAQRFKDSYESELTMDDVSQYVRDRKKLYHSLKNEPIDTYFIETMHSDHCEMGSTDVGDVSYVVPTATLNTACYSYGGGAHSWQWSAQGKSDIAMKGMWKASDVLADSAIRLIENPELIEKAKQEFHERTCNDPYQCLIPKNIKPHVIE